MSEALQPDVLQQLQQRNDAYLQLQRKHIQYRSYMHGKFYQIGEIMLPHIAEQDRQIERVLTEYQEICRYFDALKAQVAKDIKQMHNFINQATSCCKQQFLKTGEQRYLNEVLKARIIEVEAELRYSLTAYRFYSFSSTALTNDCYMLLDVVRGMHSGLKSVKAAILEPKCVSGLGKLAQAITDLVAQCVSGWYPAQYKDATYNLKMAGQVYNQAPKYRQEDECVQTVAYQSSTRTDKSVQCTSQLGYQNDTCSTYFAYIQAEKLQKTEQENDVLRQQLAVMAYKINAQMQVTNSLRMQLLDAYTTITRTAHGDQIGANKMLRQRAEQLEVENSELNSLLDSAKKDFLILQKRVISMSYARSQAADIEGMRARANQLEQRLTAEQVKIETVESAALQLASEFKSVCATAEQNHQTLRGELAERFRTAKQYDLLYAKVRRLERENTGIRSERQYDVQRNSVQVQTDYLRDVMEGRGASNSELRELQAAVKKSKQLCATITEEKDYLDKELAFAKRDRQLAAQAARLQEEEKVQLSLLLDTANKEIVRLRNVAQRSADVPYAIDALTRKTTDAAVYTLIPSKVSSFDNCEDEYVQTATATAVATVRVVNSPVGKGRQAVVHESNAYKAEIAEIGDIYPSQPCYQLFGRLGLEQLRQHAFIVDNLVTFMQAQDNHEARGKANAYLYSTLRRMRFLCSANVILPEELRPQEASALISCLPASLRSQLCEAFCSVRTLEVYYDELESKLPQCEEIKPILEYLKSDIPTLCLRSRSISFYLDQILLELYTNEIQCTASADDRPQILDIVELNEYLLDARNRLHAKEAELALSQTEHYKLALQSSREIDNLSYSIQALEKHNQQLKLEFQKANEQLRDVSGGSRVAEDQDDAIQSLQERVRIYQATIAKLRSENLQLSQDCALQRYAAEAEKSGGAEQISRLESYNTNLVKENESLRYQVAALSICSENAPQSIETGIQEPVLMSGTSHEERQDVPAASSARSLDFDVESCRLKLSG